MAASGTVGRPMLWNLLGNAVSFVSSFATGVIVARLLGPVEMGKFAVAIALMALLQSAFFLGTTNFVVREKDAHRELIGSVFSLALVQGLVVGGLIFALADLVASFQRVEAVQSILYVLAIVPVLAPFEGVALAVCIRSMRFDLVMVITVLKAVVQCGVSLGLAFAGYGVYSLAWGLVAGCTVSATLGFVILQRQVGIQPNRRHWRRMLGFSVQSLAVTWLTTANARLPEFMLGRLSGLANVGLFSRANATSELVRRAALYPAAQVLFPRLSHGHAAGEDLARGTLDFNSRLVTFFWPMFTLLSVLAGPVIALLYGDQWHGASPALAMLALAAAINVSSSGMTEALLIVDRQSWTMRIELSRTVLGFIMIVVAAPFGLWAVAMTRCIDGLIAAILYTGSLSRLNLIDVRAWLLAQCRAIALALMTIAPCLLLPVARMTGHAPFVEIAVTGMLGLAGFALGAWLLRDPFVHDGFRALGHIVPALKAKLR